MANSEGYLERVRPDDGRQESSWVFLIVLLILLLGGYTISTHQTVPAKLPGHLLLDVKDKATLTALRNAGDEILFLAEDGEKLPDVETLLLDGIPPFATPIDNVKTHRWALVDGRCYLGTPLRGNSQVRFLLTLDERVAVYWQPENGAQGHDHRNDISKQKTESAASSCTPDENWQVLSNA